MENEIFPWNPHSHPPIPQDPTPTPTSKSKETLTQGLILKTKPFLPYLIIAFFLGFLFLITQKSKGTQGEVSQSNNTIDVFTPLFPIQKGEEIPLEALRLIPVRKGMFTKTQLFQIMNLDNVSSLKGRLLAKKALFPNKVIFWSDLELKKPSPPKSKIQIHYSKGE